MEANMSDLPGRLLRELPAVYHPLDELRVLLSLFEELLLGPSAEDTEGLEEKIRHSHVLFDPDRAWSVFLPWLAQWVALSRVQGLPDERLRKLVAGIVPLYAIRGTKGYLSKLLVLFMPDDVSIVIDDQEMTGLTIGKSKLGVESWLGVDRPFWFKVKIGYRMTAAEPEESERLKKRLEETARSVIDLAKPAHTSYQLEWETTK